jgi:hypothetical protein
MGPANCLPSGQPDVDLNVVVHAHMISLPVANSDNLLDVNHDEVGLARSVSAWAAINTTGHTTKTPDLYYMSTCRPCK